MCADPLVEVETNGGVQQEDRSQFPSLGKMALNLATAVKSEIKSRVSGETLLNPEDIKTRVAICENCEFFNKPSERCRKCGCFLKWKTAWRSQRCPIGKW